MTQRFLTQCRLWRVSEERYTWAMQYVSAKEAAELWDRDPTVIRRFCREGLIPGAYKGKKAWRVPAYDSPPVVLPRREKLTETEKREVAALGHAGANRSHLARTYGVGRRHVYRRMRTYPPEQGA